MSQLFFCERFRTSCCISPEIVGEIQHLVRKCSQKIHYDIVLIIFLEPTIKLITGIILIMEVQVLFPMFFSEKDPHLSAVE